MSGHDRIIEVGDADFKQRVLEADGIVAVDFWAPRCGPCRQIKPYMPKLALDFEGSVTFAAYNHDLGCVIYDELGLQGVPNIVFFKSGEIVGSVVGGKPYKELKEAVVQALAGHAEPRVIEPELEQMFEETAEGLAEERDAELKPLYDAFNVKAKPVLDLIKPPYMEALNKHREGEIDKDAYQAAYQTYLAAYEAELGAEAKALDEARQPIEAEHDEAVQHLIDVYADMAGEIYLGTNPGDALKKEPPAE